jgi:hypothetical protein
VSEEPARTGQAKRTGRPGRRPVQVTFASLLLLFGGIGVLSLALSLLERGLQPWWRLERRVGQHETLDLVWQVLVGLFSGDGPPDARKTAGTVLLFVVAAVMLTAAVGLFLRRRFGQRLALLVLGAAGLGELYAAAHTLLRGSLADACGHMANGLLLLGAMLVTADPRVAVWLEERTTRVPARM